jgi:hypothetical protein
MKQKTDTEFQHRFGKLVKGKHPLLLEKSQLSDSQNIMPGYQVEQRRGMAALTASAVATGLRWKSMTQFRDLRGDTDVILAHTYDSVGGEDLYQGSALPPNAITWTKKYDLTASCEKCQFANVAKAMLIANNKDFLIWRGTSHFPTGVWKYTSANTAYTLFSDELFDNDTSTSMSLNSFTTSDEVLTLSEMPLDKISPVIGNTNGTASYLLAYYYNGAWTELCRLAGTLTNIADHVYLTDYMELLSLWTDESGGTGAVTQETFDSQEVLKLTNGATPTGYGKTGRTADWDLAADTTNTTITVRLYFDQVGTPADGDEFVMYFHNTDGTRRLMARWSTDGLEIYDGASWGEAGTDLVVLDTWQTYTFDVNWDGMDCDVYLDGVLKSDDHDCSNDGQSLTADYLSFNQKGNTTADNITYIDYVRIGTVLESPTNYSLADGTDSSGASLGASGDITWTQPADEVQTDIQGVPGFAYKFKWTVALDSSVSMTGLTVHSPMAAVKNIWDGTPEGPLGCYVYDGTDHTDYFAYVNNTVESQYMDLSGVTTTDKIYVGFPVRVNKIIFYPSADGKNASNVSVSTVKYFNAAGAATTVGTFTDTMETNNATFSQKGYLSWTDPGWQNEKMTIIGGDDIPMYWYEIVVDAALDATTYVYYIRGVPIPKDPDPSRGCFAFKRRAWQIAPRNRENQVRYSAADLPNVWNGTDSGYIAFGERPLKAAGAFYNETVLFADTEMWMLQGSTPTNFGRLRLSSKVGISSPESLLEIESGVIVSDVIKVVLAWFFFDGIWMFDGVRVWKISAPDIDSFFDPDHTDYINPAKLAETTGEYDYATQTARWSVYSGSGTATTPTKQIVMHFPTLEFGIFDYGTDIDAMLSVVNEKYYLVGGGNSDGRFYQLDSGLTDLVAGTATAVDAFVVTADQFIEYSDGLRQKLSSIWSEAQAAGGQLELDEYPDGSKTPVNIAKQSMTVTGKIFGALRKTLKFIPGQKTTKFRIRNRSKNARMKLLGYSTTVDKGRTNE